MRKNKWLLALLAASVSLASLPAMAESLSVALDEITVTANKMEENIHKVPQSISVLDETEIEEMGLKNSMDVLDQIPSMLTTPNFGVGVTFYALSHRLVFLYAVIQRYFGLPVCL